MSNITIDVRTAIARSEVILGDALMFAIVQNLCDPMTFIEIGTEFGCGPEDTVGTLYANAITHASTCDCENCAGDEFSPMVTEIVERLLAPIVAGISVNAN